MALGAAVIGCPGTRSPGSRGSTGSSECAERLPGTPPAFEPPPPLEPVRSRLGIEVSAEHEAIVRELEREVPVALAGERGRPIGAPGEVTYSVRRGRLGVKLESDRLIASVPVSVEVEVCKPIGPFCPVYGRCSPRLAAIASVPLLLGEDYEIGQSKVGVSVVRSCTIAGIDATPEIEKQARGAVGVVQNRIARSLPRIRPSVAGVWDILHHPVSLGTTACLRIKPEQLAQAKPRSEPTRLVTSLSAEGTLAVEEPCLGRDAPVQPGALPKLETRDQIEPGVDLRVPIVTSFTDASAALARSLALGTTSADRVRLVKLEARGVAAGGRGALALQGTLAGPVCGEAWWLADPWYDAATARIRLRNVQPAPGQPRSAELAEVAARIESGGAISLPVDVSAGPRAIEGLIQRFGEDLPKTARLESSMAQSAVDGVRVSSDGLVAVAVFSGSAAVRLR